MREEVGTAPTYGEEWPRIYCLENLENIRVIRADGRIVSSAAIYPHEVRFDDARLRIGGITGVATDSAYRRRGYATQLTHACIERMAELGCHLSLLGSGVPSWYRKLGWEYAGVERSYQFNRGNRRLLPSDSGLVMARGGKWRLRGAGGDPRGAGPGWRAVARVVALDVGAKAWSGGVGGVAGRNCRRVPAGARDIGYRVRRTGRPRGANAVSTIGVLGRSVYSDVHPLHRGAARERQADATCQPGCAMAAGRGNRGAGRTRDSAVSELRADDPNRRSARAAAGLWAYGPDGASGWRFNRGGNRRPDAAAQPHRCGQTVLWAPSGRCSRMWRDCRSSSTYGWRIGCKPAHGECHASARLLTDETRLDRLARRHLHGRADGALRSMGTL